MNKIKSSKSEIAFDVVLIIIMIVFCITTLYPFLYLLSLSITSSEVSLTTFHLIPPKIDFNNFKVVLSAADIGTGFKNTIVRTLLGTAIQLLAIICTAYPLSKKYFPHRNFWTSMLVFTMFFSGGLIPSYLLIKNMHMFNSIWSLILPGLIPTYTMLIVRNFFMGIPDSLEESARIDGANDIIILFKIILPLSMPIIATVILWQAVGHWNAWFDSLIYIQNQKKQVLQVILRRIVLAGSQDAFASTGIDVNVTKPESLKAATIMVVILPILCVYPFVQKYFVQGIMVGSLKG
jgi:putative aldouronate transport system permease protein